MQIKKQWLLIDFVLKEWLLVAPALGAVLTSVYLGRVTAWTAAEMQVLLLLLALFVAVSGLQHSGAFDLLAAGWQRRRGRLAVKLVLMTFFLAMVVTNDAALIVMVPLTLALKPRAAQALVILEALAANAGSALTPVGNPQNLFIYWSYALRPLEFVMAMAPLALLFLLVLLVAAAMVDRGEEAPAPVAAGAVCGRKTAIYTLLLGLVLLAVVHVLPVYAALAVVVYALLCDRQALRIDYTLLFSFAFFFVLAANLKTILAASIACGGHVFLFSALASQVMSNVPAALLFARFSADWHALLWGVNVGGFGSLFGSLANLIAYRIYVAHHGGGVNVRFALKFQLWGYAAFLLAAALYAVVWRC